MDIPGGEQGVIVTAVQPGGVAARMEIQPGDRIVRINGQPIRSVNELLPAINVKRDQWEFSISRGGQILTLSIGN